jgi:hypothetical protein
MVFGLAIPLTLGPTTPLHAGFQDGVVALRDGDHGSAHREFLALAEEGSRDAQLVLGQSSGAAFRSILLPSSWIETHTAVSRWG